MTDVDLRDLLLHTYHSANGYADMTGWWRNPEIMRRLACALAGLHPDVDPTAILGIESRGLFLAGLVSLHRCVGVVKVSKGEPDEDIPDWFWGRHAPPDYLDRDLVLYVLRALVSPNETAFFSSMTGSRPDRRHARRHAWLKMPSGWVVLSSSTAQTGPSADS